MLNRARARRMSAGTGRAGRAISGYSADPVGLPGGGRSPSSSRSAYRDRGIDAAVAFAERVGPPRNSTPTSWRACAWTHRRSSPGSTRSDHGAPCSTRNPSSTTCSAHQLDQALAAIGRYVDRTLPAPWVTPTPVAALVSGAASHLNMTAVDRQHLRRAALLTAGYGRLGVSNTIWDKPGPLTVAEWERVRLAAQLAERMLRQSPTLAPVARIVVHVRERLDGSGYPSGVEGPAIATAARLLAVADAYQAMIEPRPHRGALSSADAAHELKAKVRLGRLDVEAVEAILAAAGPTNRAPPDPRSWP